MLTGTLDNQDAIIDGINLLSKFVNGASALTDTIGALPVLGGIGGLFAGAKNAGFEYTSVYTNSFLCFEYALYA